MTSLHFRKERLAVCRNPAEERARKRMELLAAIEADLKLTHFAQGRRSKPDPPGAFDWWLLGRAGRSRKRPSSGGRSTPIQLKAFKLFDLHPACTQ